MVSIDPGIRTWCTLYDPQGEHIERWGTNTSTKQYKLCKWIDYFTSKLDQWKNESKKKKSMRKPVHVVSVSKRVRKRIKKLQLSADEKREYYRSHQTSQTINSRLAKRLRKELDFLRARLKDLTRDFHYRLANYCCAGYELICYPTFDSQQLCTKVNRVRKINRMNVRKLMNWSSGVFFRRLEHVRRRYDSLVYREGEQYTTQGCTVCGTLNKGVGASKVYKCVNPACRVKIGRDDGGARTFGLKCLNSILSGLLSSSSSLSPMSSL